MLTIFLGVVVCGTNHRLLWLWNDRKSWTLGVAGSFSNYGSHISIRAEPFVSFRFHCENLVLQHGCQMRGLRNRINKRTLSRRFFLFSLSFTASNADLCMIQNPLHNASFFQFILKLKVAPHTSPWIRAFQVAYSVMFKAADADMMSQF